MPSSSADVTLHANPLEQAEGSRHDREGQETRTDDVPDQPHDWRGWLSPSTADPFAIETFGLDLSEEMRSMFGITDGDLQAQLILGSHQPQADAELWFPNIGNVFDSPFDRSEPPGDGVIRIKYLRAHGRTAYIPGMVST